MTRREECRYCGIVAHGHGCAYAPEGIHVEVGDSEHCIFCGSTGYGSGCSYNIEDESMVHKHGHGEGKCVYCGSTATGYGCPYSPDGRHQR